jgi:hypothetical protein
MRGWRVLARNPPDRIEKRDHPTAMSGQRVNPALAAIGRGSLRRRTAAKGMGSAIPFATVRSVHFSELVNRR